MIGSLLNRGLVLIFGYAYPAYECYKSVEMNKPNIELLRFWCQYWILVAFMTACERIADIFIGWVPMYGEAKLAFLIYLWLPKTKGTTYVYNSFFRPCLAKHETEIDNHLLELRTRASDMAFMYWQQSAGYAQTRVLDILRYIISQSTAKQPAKPQDQEDTSIQKLTVASTPILGTAPNSQNKQPSSPAPPSDLHKEDSKSAAEPSEDSEVALNKHKTSPTPALSETSRTSNSSQDHETLVDSDSVQSAAKPTTVRDMLVEENGPFTRARLRKVNNTLLH